MTTKRNSHGVVQPKNAAGMMRLPDGTLIDPSQLQAVPVEVTTLRVTLASSKSTLTGGGKHKEVGRGLLQCSIRKLHSGKMQLLDEQGNPFDLPSELYIEAGLLLKFPAESAWLESIVEMFDEFESGSSGGKAVEFDIDIDPQSLALLSSVEGDGGLTALCASEPRNVTGATNEMTNVTQEKAFESLRANISKGREIRSENIRKRRSETTVAGLTEIMAEGAQAIEAAALPPMM